MAVNDRTRNLAHAANAAEINLRDLQTLYADLTDEHATLQDAHRLLSDENVWLTAQNGALTCALDDSREAHRKTIEYYRDLLKEHGIVLVDTRIAALEVKA